jgi:hypothetical protein
MKETDAELGGDPMGDADAARRRYWDQISLIEDLREFHPDVFNALSTSEQAALLEYYALDREVPDVFAYKLALDVRSPQLAVRAAAARRAFEQKLGLTPPSEA